MEARPRRRAAAVLLAALALAATSTRDALAQPDPAAVQALAARADARGELPVMVELAVPFVGEGTLGPGRRARQRREIRAARAGVEAALAGRSGRVRRAFETIPYAVADLDGNAVRALGSSPWVASMREERAYRPLLDTSVPMVEGDVMAALGFDGAGRTVVVVDTGVDDAHPNLVGKLVDEACFASGSPGPSGDCPNGQETDFSAGSGADCTFSVDCRHGTHVAGIAVGEGPSYDGVAIGADVISIQVASIETNATACAPLSAPCPIALESDVLAALEEVYQNFRLAHPIAAVNVSLGGPARASQATCDSLNGPTKAAIDNLRSVDIATVIAAGNDGLDNAISEPACISSAVSVGASSNYDTAATFSNAASFLSLWAPGVGITAPRAQTTLYTTMSGTSQAAPHVSGAWAILSQAVPGLSVGQVLAALQATGAPISHPEATTTRIRIRAAFEDLTVACADGIDTDGDGLVDLADPGCADALDDDERGSGTCDNGVDDDGDGWADAPDDPGCADAYSLIENPQCQDGLNNDPGQDTLVDFDGGASLNGGVPLTSPDPQCVDKPWRDREKTSYCGLGAELALLLAPLAAWRRGRRRIRRRHGGGGGQ